MSAMRGLPDLQLDARMRGEELTQPRQQHARRRSARGDSQPLAARPPAAPAPARDRRSAPVVDASSRPAADKATPRGSPLEQLFRRGGSRRRCVTDRRGRDVGFSAAALNEPARAASSKACSASRSGDEELPRPEERSAGPRLEGRAKDEVCGPCFETPLRSLLSMRCCVIRARQNASAGRATPSPHRLDLVVERGRLGSTGRDRSARWRVWPREGVVVPLPVLCGGGDDAVPHEGHAVSAIRRSSRSPRRPASSGFFMASASGRVPRPARGQRLLQGLDELLHPVVGLVGCDEGAHLA